jgi:glucosamine-6-phosphate deaminase
MREKIEMILEHVSQLDPLFPGPYDDRQFWERARDRNVAFAQICNKIGVEVNGVGAEVFKTFEKL